jgi:hypothetical protein
MQREYDKSPIDSYFGLSIQHYKFMQLAESKLNNMMFLQNEDDYIFDADVLAGRFQKLQSVMGEKLTKSIMETLGEADRSTPFREYYDGAVKLGVVKFEYSEWDVLRKEHNHIGHGDYEDISFNDFVVMIDNFINMICQHFMRHRIRIVKHSFHLVTTAFQSQQVTYSCC